MLDKKIILAVFLLLAVNLTHAQELIINGDFEIGATAVQTVPPNWDNVSGTPDHCISVPVEACTSTLPLVIPTNSPQGGKWVRFFNSSTNNERFGQYMCSPLEAGQTYSLSFWAARSKLNTFVITANPTGIDVGFSMGPPTGTGAGTNDSSSINLPTLDAWVLHTFSFVASGNWNFISFAKSTVGNMNAVYIDDVSLIGPFSTSFLGNDTALCSGGSFTLDVSNSQGPYLWHDGSTDSVFTVSSAGTYYVETGVSTPCSTTDTIVVTTGVASAAWTNPSPVCLSSGTVNLGSMITGDTGGTWSGTGITNTTTGIFDPSVAGVGTWPISYAVTANCGDTITQSITVTSAPDATIAAAGPFCANDPSLTLSAATAGGVWTGTGITNSASGTFDPTVAGAGTWTITYTLSGACGAIDTEVITVNAAADATIAAAGPFCTSDLPLNLSAVSPGGTWTGTGITDGVNGTFDPSVAGIGTWTITYTLSGTCGATDTEDIAVNASPNANIVTPGSFCAGDSIALVSDTATTYLWLLNGGSMGDTTQTIVVSIAGGYQVIVSNGTGCIDTSNIATVTVNALPVIDSSLVIINPSNCGNSDGSILGLTVVGIAPLTFEWINTLNVVMGTSLDLSNVPTDFYNFTVTDNNGCSGSEVFFVPEVIAPSAPVAGNDTTYCVGDPVSDLIAIGSGGVLTWYSDAALTDSIGTGSPFASGVATTDTFYVTETNGICESLSDTVMVTFNTGPVVGLTASQDSICLGDPVTLSATGGGTYLWSTGEITSSIVVSPTTTTSYNVLVTGSNGCSSAPSSIIVTIFSGSIIAGFDVDISSGNIPLDVAFTDTSIGAVSWTWDFSYDSVQFNIESTNQNPIHLYVDDGLFQVMLIATSANGCSDTATFVISAIGKEEAFIPNLFSPNGDQNNDILYVRGSGIDFLDLVVYDRWGEKVYEGDKSQIWAKEGTYPVDVGWDGTFKNEPMNTAVFVYILKGAFLSGKEIDEKGNITLIR